MQNGKKLYSSATAKVFFSLLFSLGLLNFSHAGDLTAAAAVQNISTMVEKQNNNTFHDPLLLIHEKWIHRQLNVSASYETPWQDSIILAKVSDYEQPGCAGLKASFSF
ncbi:MAG TPA: hypothetical protein VIK59_00285 [Verrucomicrobiae bacterium]